MQVRTSFTFVRKSASRSRFSSNFRLRATALGVLQLFAVQAMLCGPGLVHAEDCSPPPGDEASDPASAATSNAVDDGSTDSTQSLSTGTNDGGNDGGDSGDGGGSSANVSGTDGNGADPSGTPGAGSGGEGASSSDSSAQNGGGGADTANSGEDSGGLGLHGFLDLGYASSPLWQFMQMLKVHDPIDVSLADKQHVQIDYVSGGAAPLRLGRSYHSNSSVNTARVTLPMGTGWHHFYDRTLQVISANQVRLHRANGRTLDFTASGSTWSSTLPAGVLTQVTGGWQYVNHRDTIETYDGNGRLLSMSSGGLTTGFQYNAGGQLVGATNPFGRAISFAYDASGRLNSATLPGGGSLNYTYDGHNNLVGVRFADGALRQYVYENAGFPNALTGVIDESGRRRLTWGYDASGRPNHGHYGSGSNSIDITYAGGTVTTTDARGTQRIRTLGTVAGRTVVTAYQTATTADSPATNWLAGTDAAGNPASLTTSSGEIQQFSVDSRGRPTAVTRAAGTAQALSVQSVWHPIFRKETQITAAGVTRNVAVDAFGRITSITRTAAGATATTLGVTYNAQNLPQSITDARGATATFTYDTAGNRATMTNALSQVTTYSNYTAHGQPGRIQRADGVVVTQTFDTRGRVASRTIAGLATSFAYDPAGRVTTITLPDGSWRSITYDAAGKIASATNHRSESASVSRDATGLPTNKSVYAANGTLAQTVAQRFNSLGRIAAVTDSRGYATQFTYAADARPLGATDALGLTRTVQLDLLNRKTALTQPNTAAMRQITGKATATSNFGYDTRGNHVSVAEFQR